MKNMSGILGAALLVAGILSLVYGGINYTQDRTALKVGPLQVEVQEDKRLNVPVWAGVGLLAVGGALLALGMTKR
jgi:hypothetical protein